MNPLKLLLELYCVPGKFFAEWGYLFPKHGQLWASGRRRQSKFVHILYSTFFWMLLALTAIVVRNWPESRPEKRATSIEDTSENRATESSKADNMLSPSLVNENDAIDDSPILEEPSNVQQAEEPQSPQAAANESQIANSVEPDVNENMQSPEPLAEGPDTPSDKI